MTVAYRRKDKEDENDYDDVNIVSNSHDEQQTIALDGAFLDVSWICCGHSGLQWEWKIHLVADHVTILRSHHGKYHASTNSTTIHDENTTCRLHFGGQTTTTVVGVKKQQESLTTA